MTSLDQLLPRPVEMKFLYFCNKTDIDVKHVKATKNPK